MRSLPIFRACVRTWRYRLSRAATPTVNRSATTTISPLVVACNRPRLFCQRPSEAVAVGSGGEPAPQSIRRDVVHERPLAVDLDHRQPLPIALLELRVAADVHLGDRDAELAADLLDDLACPFAEMAAGRA